MINATNPSHAANAKRVRSTGVRVARNQAQAAVGKQPRAVSRPSAPARQNKSEIKPRTRVPSGKLTAGGAGASAKKRRPTTSAPGQPVKARVSERSGTQRQPLKQHQKAAATPANPTKTRQNTRHTLLFALLSACFTVSIVGMICLAARQAQAYERFVEMRRVVESQTFYAGTTVEGVDVSSMTLDDAIQYWQTHIEPGWANRTITMDEGTSATAADFGYTSDYQTVLSNAWTAGRSGSLEARYRAAVSHEESPAAYRVTRSLYDDARVSQFVRYAAKQVDAPAQDAALEGFDIKKNVFSFTEAQSGKKLNTDALYADIVNALEQGGGNIERQIETIPPAVTAKALKKQFGRITTAVTNASSSNSNRLSNIKQALAYINGTCLEPGETFSFNKTVGRRTTERGFKIATAYSSGDVTEEVGGGICQVSTTLFNAAVKADLKIVERHNHSLTVSYVDAGKDATVNWDSQDLRFKNTTGEKLYICCYLTNNKRVRVGIFGKLIENGETITVETETIEEIDFETEYEPSDTLSKGRQETISNGKKGCKAVAYKVRWDAKGREIDRELLCKSYYRPKNAVVAYGT